MLLAERGTFYYPLWFGRLLVQIITNIIQKMDKLNTYIIELFQNPRRW